MDKGIFCRIKYIYKLLDDFEQQTLARFGLGINEGIVLCSLASSPQTSGAIAAQVQMLCSQTSKVIASLEKKGLIERIVGKEDKRQMFFSITGTGQTMLESIMDEGFELPLELKQILAIQTNKTSEA